MGTCEYEGFRFVELPGGEVMIHLPSGSEVGTTMDGRASVTIPWSAIIRLVSEQFVKPAVIERIRNLSPEDVLLGPI